MKTSLPSLIPTKFRPIFQILCFLKTITDIPSRYEDLEWHVIKEIPTGYNRVDIVADNYKPVSIKMQVRDG